MKKQIVALVVISILILASYGAGYLLGVHSAKVPVKLSTEFEQPFRFYGEPGWDDELVKAGVIGLEFKDGEIILHYEEANK